jgi:hypothetical protein
MERVLDPALADLRFEHQDALRRQRSWRARWIRAAGSLTVLYLIATHVGVSPVETFRPSPPDAAPIARVLAASAALVAVMTAALVAIVMSNTLVPFAPHPVLVLYLLPAILPVTVPCGFALAVSWIGTGPSWHTAPRTVIVAAALSIMMFIMVGWLAPEANQMYRVTVFGGEMPRGFNELTFAGMRRRLAEQRERMAWPFGSARNPIDPTLDIRIRESEYHYQGCFAISVAPLALGVFALSISHRRRVVRIVAILAMSGLYFGWYGWMRSPVLTFADLSPAVVAWLPNLALVAVTLISWGTAPTAK